MKETINRFWKIAYIKLIDDDGEFIPARSSVFYHFKDKKAEWLAQRLFGRIYWCIEN